MQIYDVNRASGAQYDRRWLAPGLATSLCVLALTGCASQPVPHRIDRIDGMRIDTSQTQSPAFRQRVSYEYHVLAGEMAIQRNQRNIAAKEYVAALDYSDAPALAKRATRIALFAGDPALAYKASQRWAQRRPGDLDAQRTAARLALTRGDDNGLALHAPALVAAAASPDIGYRLLADVLSGEPAHADLAIEIASRIAQQDKNSAPAQYALGVVALRYDRNDVAARAAERALAIDPDWNDAVLLQAGVWIRKGQSRKAQALVDRLPGNNASRAQYHLALARLLIEAGQNKPALEEFQHAIALAPNNADARYGLAILSLSSGDLDRAEDEFTRLYKANERGDDAAYYLGTIAEQRKQYARAQRWYQRVENGSHAFESQVRGARMIELQGDMAGARRRLAELRGVYPDLAGQLYAAEGQLLFDADDSKTAIVIYNRGLDELPGNTDLLYGRSIVYERVGRVDAAKADLRDILADEPDDTRALNALGYLLTNHSSKYEQALDYIQRALESAPDNPAVLDSMGWVQYHLGHLAQARNYLERAYRGLPEADIAAHLGEVLWQQGQHDAARRVWQKALAEDPDHQLLRDTMARFEK